jgi:CubicO group peptidase (beta-lactamase class C family)
MGGEEMRMGARFCPILGIFLFLIQCVNDAPYKVNDLIIPEQLNDGWTIDSPRNVGLNDDSITRVRNALMDESKYYNALGLLIIKNDAIVFEAYPRDLADRDHIHHLQSATKSFTSLAVGICKKQGWIGSLDSTLYHYIPDKFPSDSLKRTITLRHLLTMRSGIKIDNSDFAYTMLVDRPVDPARYILNLPLYASPGDSMYYRDCDPQLVSYVIQAASTRKEEEIIRQFLFEPLGITDYHWEDNPDGVSSGAYGLHLRPRDMAKVGQTLLHNGRWQGKQVIDSAWIYEATRSYVTTQWEDITWDYGFYWWLIPEYGAFTAAGHGGQYIFVVPHQQLVVVMLSMPDSNDDYVGTSLKRFLELIKPILEKK